MPYTLYWIREDGQGDFNMGSYPTQEAAEAAIPAAKAELLGQCGEDFLRAEIEAGRWSIAQANEELDTHERRTPQEPEGNPG